jgi:eukaryotic-like serine/threonine-protein kinase
MHTEVPDPLVGQVVAGRYRVLRPLGAGGMGQVYLAEHEAIEKKVALKVLRPEYSRKEDIVTRFQQEAISASRIKHPNVLDVFDFGRLETGETFLAMEFLEGHDLSDELTRCNVLDVSRGLHLAGQICRALAAAHSRGVVHRDMKPDNVFLQRTLDGDEIVKIVDFGIAQLRTTEEAAQSAPTRRRLTKTGMIFGTPEYMAPEQAAGRPADLRVDIYAVGVILYEMFTGAVPFTGDSFMAVLAATLNEPPPPMRQINPDLALSGGLEQVIMRALAKNPNDRFQTMGELAAAIASTPEGTQLGRMSHLPVPQGNISVAPGAPTAPFGAVAHAPGPGAPSPGTAAAAAAQTVSHTQLSGQAATQPPSSPPSLRLVLGSLGAIGTAVAIAAFAFLGGSRASEAPPQAVEPAPSAPPPPDIAPEPPPPPVVSAAPVAEPAEPEVTPQATEVTLHVETNPPGATLTKDSFQVCDATPCDVVVDRKEGVTLDAVKGALRGQTKILALKDQTVTIDLKAPQIKRAAEPKPAAERMCEVEINGLKILRPCN